MNIKVSQQAIYKAINIVEKISINKNLSDIANGILIEVDNDMVKVTSVSMDIIVENKFKYQMVF